MPNYNSSPRNQYRGAHRWFARNEEISGAWFDDAMEVAMVCSNVTIVDSHMGSNCRYIISRVTFEGCTFSWDCDTRITFESCNFINCRFADN